MQQGCGAGMTWRWTARCASRLASTASPHSPCPTLPVPVSPLPPSTRTLPLAFSLPPHACAPARAARCCVTRERRGGRGRTWSRIRSASACLPMLLVVSALHGMERRMQQDGTGQTEEWMDGWMGGWVEGGR
eukprot:1064844-Rhodomonas_salina.1